VTNQHCPHIFHFKLVKTNWWKPTFSNFWKETSHAFFMLPKIISSTPWHTGAKSWATESWSALSKAKTRLKHHIREKRDRTSEKGWWITYNLVVDYFFGYLFWRSEFPSKNVTKCLRLPNMLWDLGSFFLVEKDVTESNSCLPGTAFAHAHAARVDPPFPTPDSTMTCAPEAQDQRILHLCLGGWWFAIPGMLLGQNPFMIRRTPNLDNHCLLVKISSIQQT